MRIVSTASMGIIVIMALSACDQASEQATPRSSDNTSPELATAANTASPCALITSAEFATAVGRPVTRQEASGKKCTFYTDDPLVYVNLEVDREDAAASWKGITAGHTMIGADKNLVPGIRDQAFFGPRDRLYVLSGDVFLAIEAGFDSEARERGKKVAMLVQGKLR